MDGQRVRTYGGDLRAVNTTEVSSTDDKLLLLLMAMVIMLW